MSYSSSIDNGEQTWKCVRNNGFISSSHTTYLTQGSELMLGRQLTPYPEPEPFKVSNVILLGSTFTRIAPSYSLQAHGRTSIKCGVVFSLGWNSHIGLPLYYIERGVSSSKDSKGICFPHTQMKHLYINCSLTLLDNKIQ